MKLSLRIPLTLTIIVIVTGIIAFIKRAANVKPFSASSFAIWLVISLILVGITIWSWRRNQQE